MACFFRCDSCKVEAPAVQRGYTYVIPDTWWVVSDGTLKKRTFEAVVCSEACVGVIAAAHLGNENIDWKQVSR